jgi:glutamate-1-semialdehyde 2,1-aminomutase
MNPRTRCKAIFEDASRILVGGVNSPVRAFRAVGGEPLIIAKANGSHIADADGNDYIDFVCSWGAMILGHAHPAVTWGIQQQAALGTSYGMTNELEVELARRVQSAMPSMERIRFVSSGTEATMSAIRAARAFTKRDLILKFEGCYHGHGDSFLSEAGSGLATLGIAASPGVPAALAELTLNAPYNNIVAAQKVFDAHMGKVAAVIVEPVAANMGVVPPGESFLSQLCDLARKNGSLIIFDEVISGFRISRGGAQSLFGLRPDLTTLGKIIGGGLPAAAYGGRADIMEQIAPLGPVYQAGTLSGNPLAMRAGIETLRQLEVPGFYEQLNQRAAWLVNEIRGVIKEAGVPAMVNAVGSLLTLFFTESEIVDYDTAKKSDAKRFAKFFTEMLNRGVFLPPSQYEAWFVSAQHSDTDLATTVEAVRASLQAIAKG